MNCRLVGRIMEEKQHKVMLIEDNELDRMAFMRFVRNNALPYDCVAAESVAQSREILASQQFDVIISDYMLGDGTVFDILDLVKDTPIIVVTGAGDQEIAVKAWRAGAYDYFIKDHNHDYLKTIPITIENVIRHRRTESKLRLLSAAVMSTKECVYITDMEQKITFVNKAFLESYGYAEEEIVGKDGSIVWVASDQNAKVRGVFETRCAGGGSGLAFVHKRKDGSIFPVSLSRSLIKNPNGEPVAVVSVAHNITEWIRVENELKAAMQEKRLTV